jgi:hypothetical protein
MVVLVSTPSMEISSSVSHVTLFKTIWVLGSAMDCAATTTMSLGEHRAAWRWVSTCSTCARAAAFIL